MTEPKASLSRRLCPLCGEVVVAAMREGYLECPSCGVRLDARQRLAINPGPLRVVKHRPGDARLDDR